MEQNLIDYGAVHCLIDYEKFQYLIDNETVDCFIVT